MPLIRPSLTIISFIFLIFLIISYHSQSVLSVSNNVVISEIQITGNTTTDEFVELYNPTSADIDLSGWRLTRKTANGSQSNLVANIQGTIPAYGFFLIAHPDYNGSVSADQTYSAASNSMAANNTILLYRDSGQTLVDKVGMGNASDYEGKATVVPNSEESIERIGKVDTDNNLNDFILQPIPNPQNKLSPIEIPSSPTATPTFTLTPTQSPTPTLTSTPTPTLTPTPTSTPTPTPTPTQTITPTPTPVPTPHSRLIFTGFNRKCYLKDIIIKRSGHSFSFVRIYCEKTVENRIPVQKR